MWGLLFSQNSGSVLLLCVRSSCLLISWHQFSTSVAFQWDRNKGVAFCYFKRATDSSFFFGMNTILHRKFNRCISAMIVSHHFSISRTVSYLPTYYLCVCQQMGFLLELNISCYSVSEWLEKGMIRMFWSWNHNEVLLSTKTLVWKSVTSKTLIGSSKTPCGCKQENVLSRAGTDTCFFYLDIL